MNVCEVLWRHRYDYHAVFECEFCNAHQVHENCYADTNFDLNVIPAIKCKACGKQSNEALPEQRQGEGVQVKLEKVEVDKWVRV